MSELLVEIFSEEIPPMLQQSSGERLVQLFNEIASAKGITGNFKADYFVTPRRLVLLVNDLPTEIVQNSDSVRGPKVGANERAVAGFLAKYKLDSVSDLKVKEVSKQEYYFYETEAVATKILDVLPEVVSDVIHQLAKFWPKTMRWSSHDVRWSRPVHNILALYSGKVLDLKIWHFVANNKTYGHRVLGKGELTVKNFADYRKQLLANGVEICPRKRMENISEELHGQAKDINCKLLEDADLLEEVAGLVEYPKVMLGHIPTEFMVLPELVLVTAMKKHQRYFAVHDVDGKIAPFFLFVSNISAQSDKAIISGNERVLNARLSDAKFFYDSDNSELLEKRVGLLEHITFHKDIGNMLQRSHNIEGLAKLIAVWVPHADLLEVEMAAKICKADLTTEMVGEFPELQGIVGLYYARAQGYSNKVASAMEEHYLPIGSGAKLPQNPVSVCVALADKLDSLVSLFAIGEKPTGSKDPYAMRRQAIGVIRIILEKEVSFPFNIAIKKALQPYALLAKARCKNKVKGLFPDYSEVVAKEVLDFVFVRFAIILKEQNISDETIQAIYNEGAIDDFLIIRERAFILESLLKQDAMQKIIAAYKRAYNIYSKAEKADSCSYMKKPHKLLFKTDEEKELCRAIKKISNGMAAILKNEGYEKALQSLEDIIIPVDNFFDRVKVNDEDSGIRENRLKLLAYLCKNVNKLANFSYFNPNN